MFKTYVFVSYSSSSVAIIAVSSMGLALVYPKVVYGEIIYEWGE